MDKDYRLLSHTANHCGHRLQRLGRSLDRLANVYCKPAAKVLGVIILCWLTLLLGKWSGHQDGYKAGQRDARSSTVIDKTGRPASVWDKVKVDYDVSFKQQLEKVKNGL